MRNLAPFAAASALCVLAPAQTSSPTGYLATEGNTSLTFFGPPRRLMAIDATQSPGNFSSISWRRDGVAGTNNSYGTRTFDMTLRLGAAVLDYLDTRFDTNYVDPPTTVLSNGSVSLPSWINAPGTPPAPFDLTITFAPFTLRTGRALVWDVEITNSTNLSAVPMDRQWVSPTTIFGAAAGTGCIASGQTAPFFHTMSLLNGGPGMNPAGQVLRIAGANATPNSPWGLLLAGTDPNHNFAGLFCANIRADFGPGALPPFPLLLDVASPTGQIFDKYLGARAGSVPVGATLYTQLFSIDMAIAPMPVALSNGRTANMPAPSSGSVGAAYLSAAAGSPTGTVLYGGAPIAKVQ